MFSLPTCQIYQLIQWPETSNYDDLPTSIALVLHGKVDAGGVPTESTDQAAVFGSENELFRYSSL